MRADRTFSLAAALLAVALSAGCASAESGDSGSPNGAEDEAALTGVAADAAIEGKLRGILKDVTFTSESDYGYLVFEGDAVSDSRLSSKVVRQKLQAAVKANSSNHRDILPASCRAERLNVSSAIADGDAAVVPTDPKADDYDYAHHDKQLGIALKVMRSQLKSVVGFTFGTNADGDEDNVGPVVYVYVGVSKTTGKLIAIMTEAVYT